ncbi:MAG: amino acid adenylation domain-containing protein [Gammaproteobacteria bacterium]|nr:amino acid adenylation domain-containing protein [Gammaproteobacteria bacterium]MCP4089808.1 amino acid adenylation domain-containing protein [Gammaproteobacteria bacterium]MCP4278175.1 amino acid adenylation domain-containing protein [Gammaproteobacteria bacterium]MCP4831894.1 amino acid adenylation domain-containing protein [Gammaproteobacteria bacterium]MCP4927634.1 amino acid adenylation domain-containing protein [Gammaproteobacteria bacterium]
MSVLDLIARLRSAGIQLSIHEGKIRLKAEKGSLTKSLKQEISDHKQEIITLLSSGNTENTPELQPAKRNQALPLSFAQQRLWFLDELEPGTPVYNMPFALKVHGKLNPEALQNALNDLVEKHESLRTIFVATDNEPVQKILNNLTVTLNICDLQEQDETAVLQHTRKLAKENFNLANGPLFHLHLLQTGTDNYLLLLVIHHIISDLWSMNVFFNDLGKLYGRHTSDVAPAPEKLSIQYADYALWQRELLSGTRLETHIDYWLQQLKDAPPILPLACDHPRPPEPGYRGKWQAVTLPASLGKSLQQFAQQSGSTMFMLSFAVFCVLLNKYAGEDDIVIGTPISGRQHTNLESLIGFFLNTLALRIDASGNPTFNELLKRIKQTALDAYAHQELPFEKLVEELQPERDMSHTPVFQHMFIWQESGDTKLTLPGLTTEPAILISHDTAKFDLTLAVSNTANGIEAGFEYNTDLFDASTIKRMLGHYVALLHTVVSNSTARLSELSLLDAAERNIVVTDFNASTAEFGEPVCVHRLVEAQVERTPDASAVVLAGDHLSYAELNRRANLLAARLRELGAGSGSIVAIKLERSLELPITALAVMKSGACYMPVDPNYPEERIATMLSDSAAVVVITHSDNSLPQHAGQHLAIDTVDFNGKADNLDGGTPTDPLYCIYTSGSTGKPKGVQLSHAGLSNLLHWQLQHEHLAMPAKTLQFASFSFDVHFQEFFGTWCNGGTAVMIDEELRQDLPRLADFIAKQNIERLFLPYAALQPIAETLVTIKADPALKDIVVAGEQLQVSPELRALFSKLSNAALHNQYGPSETHVVTALTLTGDENSWPTLPSIGYPVANTHCYVLDAAGEPCPIGIPGELYIGGVQVALGYLNQPELNARKFSASPFINGDHLYKTGDRVRFLTDGQIEFLGRSDDQIKWRGFRIEPGEIEAQLTAQHSVQQAVVVLREDTPGNKRLVAYITSSSKDKASSSTALKHAIKEVLPDYMVPSIIVTLDKLPLTPSGKVARRRLPVPEYSRDQTTPYVAPRNDTEQTLVTIWAEVLGVDTNKQQVGINDDFFELGGHSLLATQLVSRIRDQFSISLPLKYIFRYPNPAELGATVSTLEAVRNTAQTDAGDDRDEFHI